MKNIRRESKPQPEAGTEPGRAHLVRRNGTRIAVVSTLAVGVVLGASGFAFATSNASGSGATSSASAKGAHHPRKPAAAGTVKSVGTDTFTLTTRAGTIVTVNTTAATTYRDRAATTPGFADVTVGARVAVEGTDTANTVAATKVSVGGAAGDRHGFGGDHKAPTAAGTVKSVGTDTFTLTTRAGTAVTVNTTAATTYRDRAATTPGFADVTVGARVAVEGTDTANTVAATKVSVGGERHGSGATGWTRHASRGVAAAA